MLRINRETDYSVVILSAMARRPTERFNAAQLAAAHGLPQPMVSKVMKQLVHAGLLCSFRGAKGGYGLARSPQEISVAEVIEAVEGPIAFTECVEKGTSNCGYVTGCTASATWLRISELVRTTLAEVSLAEMSKPTGQKVGLHSRYEVIGH
ncbi:MAG: SUF system Fe-S cluster assembly regulator [Halorhodospira sp.]